MVYTPSWFEGSCAVEKRTKTIEVFYTRIRDLDYFLKRVSQTRFWSESNQNASRNHHSSAGTMRKPKQVELQGPSVAQIALV